MQQPFLAEQPDVEIDPVERTQHADRIRTILQNAARLWFRLLVKLIYPAAVIEIVELLVVELSSGQQLAAEWFGMPEPRLQIVQRIHRARIDDIVGGDERGVECAGFISLHKLVDEIGFIGAPNEYPIKPKILGTDGRIQF